MSGSPNIFVSLQVRSSSAQSVLIRYRNRNRNGPDLTAWQAVADGLERVILTPSLWDSTPADYEATLSDATRRNRGTSMGPYC
jgi:hypothetical protein